jgi:hypothetical protein
MSNKYSFITYVPPTCFDLYKAIVTEVYTNAYKYSKFHQRCACEDLKYKIVN